MFKQVFIISLFLFSLCVHGQDESYQMAMQTALQSMDQSTSSEQYLECAGRFERIATAEKDLWMPYYYASHCLILMSYNEPDQEHKEQVLDRAQELLDRAGDLEPRESEIQVLQAFLYPSRIMVDPVARGGLYMEKVFSTLEKAKNLNPANPRIYFLEGTFKLNLPPSMGGGPEIAKPILEEALARYEAFLIPEPLWPNWGEDATRAELEKLQ